MGKSSQTSETKIPAWLEDAAKGNLAMAREIAQIGYVPYMGPDVAAFTPMQEAAFQNTADASSAFGLSAPASGMAGMPAPQEFAGGIRGYSSAPLYAQALAELQAQRPGQYDAITGMFINPMTGAAPSWAPPTQQAAPQQTQMATNRLPGGAVSSFQMPRSDGSYTGFMDMVDGGGVGASGASFSGGPLSGLLNLVGYKPIGGK